ncbi:hypothetical protein GOODEAATRI_030227 [Goodea atripinnis]|uniref:Uncharacterized protein n=1 Tax=Goodea atripinnis TaxID=208336 RepID=A0ABV0MPY6_9TELE
MLPACLHSGVLRSTQPNNILMSDILGEYTIQVIDNYAPTRLTLYSVNLCIYIFDFDIFHTSLIFKSMKGFSCMHHGRASNTVALFLWFENIKKTFCITKLLVKQLYRHRGGMLLAWLQCFSLWVISVRWFGKEKPQHFQCHLTEE